MKIMITVLGALLLVASAQGVRAQELDPGQLALARALELDGRLDSSLRALALDAGRTISFTMAAGKGLRTEVLHNILAVYQAALDQDPGNKLAAAGKARILAALGQTHQAIAAYKQALALSPQDPRLKRELDDQELNLAVRLRTALSYARHGEYWPWYERQTYRTHETTYQAQFDAPLIDGLRLGAGYLWGTLRQESLVYGDDDYDLTRRGYFLLTDWRPDPQWQLNLRLRRELFSQRDTDVYFKMPNDEELITGHALLQHVDGPWWVNASFSRERDTWPQVDGQSGRGLLSIEAQELAGLAAGRALSETWELMASAFYEMYGSPRPDQFNWNLQLTHRPLWLPGLRLAVGDGYYDQEAENLINMQVGYQMSTGSGTALELNYQLEYSSNEHSWLSQVDAGISWRPLAWLGLTALAAYGQEYAGDRDDDLSLELGLELLW